MKQKKTAKENGNEPANEMTKREFFAGQIAIGLSVQAVAGSHNHIEFMEKDVPLYAVRITDALLAELEKRN